MKPAAARAYVRQLCSLGLRGPAIMPDLLRAPAKVIPSGPNVFLALTDGYEAEYAYSESSSAELHELFVQEKHGAFRREMDHHRDWWRQHPGLPVSSQMQEVFGDIYRSDFYHCLWRRCDSIICSKD